MANITILEALRSSLIATKKYIDDAIENIETSGGSNIDDTIASATTTYSSNKIESIKSALTLPIANSNTLGGVKTGKGIYINSEGKISLFNDGTSSGSSVIDSAKSYIYNITSTETWEQPFSYYIDVSKYKSSSVNISGKINLKPKNTASFELGCKICKIDSIEDNTQIGDELIYVPRVEFTGATTDCEVTFNANNKVIDKNYIIIIFFLVGTGDYELDLSKCGLSIGDTTLDLTKSELYNPYSLTINKSTDVIIDTNVVENTIVSRWYNEKYLAIGDSQTAYDGQLLGGETIKGYQQYIKEILGVKLTSNGEGGRVMAKIDDNYSSVFAKQYINYSYTEYKLISIFLGTNDFFYNVSIGVLKEQKSTEFDITTFYGAYQTVIEYILTQNPTVKLILFTPPQNAQAYTANTSGHYLLDYVNAIKKIGETYGLSVVDLYGNSCINKITMDTYVADGTHQKNIGHKEIGCYAAYQIGNM